MPWHIGRCVVQTPPRSTCGRPHLPLAGRYHCCRCRWTMPFLCRSILGRRTPRHVSVVGCPKQFLPPTLADLTHTTSFCKERSSLGRLSRLPVWVQEASPKWTHTAPLSHGGSRTACGGGMLMPSLPPVGGTGPRRASRWCGR